MRLSTIYIDGFGIFHDIMMKNLPSGLILFQGNNEAGKSTLLAFIRTILFGFPGARSRENTHPPLAGGQQGGYIVITKDSGEELVVERRPGRSGGSLMITRADGSPGDDGALQKLLSGTNSELFKNIYAFSLSELQTFDTLKSDAVKGAIYGASAGVSIMALQKAESRLEQKLRELFKPSGSNPVINQKLAALNNIRSQLREASAGITQYDDASLNLKKTDEQILELQSASETAAAEKNRAETFMKLWGEWEALQDFETDLKELPVVVEQFPEDGIARLEQERTRLMDNQENSAKLSGGIEELEKEAGSLSINETLLEKSESFNELIDRLGRYNETVKELPLNRQKLADLKQESRCLQDSLGPEWTEEKIINIDRSLFTREAIHTFQEDLSDLKSRLAQAKERLSAKKEDHDRAVYDEKAAQEALSRFHDLKDEADEETLRALQRGRDKFASIVAELPHAEKQLVSAQESLDRVIKGIDPEWTREDLEHFDTSVSSQEKVQTFDISLTQREQEVTEAESQYESAEQNLKELRDHYELKIRDLKKEPSTSATSRDDLTKKKKVLRRLRGLLLQKDSAARDIRHGEERLSDKEQESGRFAKTLKGTSPEVLKWLALWASIAGFSAGGILFYLGRVVEGLITGGALLIIAAIILFFFWRYKVDNLSSSGSFSTLSISLQREIDTIRNLINKKKQHVSELDRQISDCMLHLNITDTVTNDDLDNLESDIEEEIEIFNRRNRLEEEADEIQSEIKRLEKTIVSIVNERSEKQRALKTIKEEWKKYLSDVNLSNGTSPKTVSLIYAKIDAAKEQIKTIQVLNERLQHMDESMKRYCELAGKVPRMPDASKASSTELIAAVDRYFEEVSQEQRMLQKREVAERTAADKKKRKEETLKAVEAAETRYKEIAEEEKNETRNWRKWLEERDLSTELSPEITLKALETIENCIRQLNTKEQLARKIADQEREITAYQERASNVFTLIDKPLPPADKLYTGINQLREEYNESKENNLKRKEIERHIKKIKAQIKSFNTQARECEKRIAVLLKGGGSKDEDQFRKRNKLYLERNRLLNDIANTERNLMKISGETDMTVLKDQLRAMTVDRLTDDLNDIGTRQKEIEEELNSLRQRKADLTHEMNSIASSDDISRLRTEEERLLEEIRDAAADWGSHALAAHLLEEAKRKFEQEQQPRVIRDAANFFKTITGDYYHKIIAPIGEDTIEIVTRDHKRKGPEELSRGTAEQLYLAVRFGYISNYSVNGERLPIIMDDILVNFDPYRASQSAKSIFQLSKTHQILYFSCHPETMAIFKKHAPQIPLYFLEEGNVKTVIKEKLDFKGKVKKDEAPKV